MKRREFLMAASMIPTCLAFAADQACATCMDSEELTKAREKLTFLEQIPLPYPENGLLPLFSEQQIKFHYEKHHLSYYKKLMQMISGKPEEELPLDELVIKARENTDEKIFNNAAQLWNHNFFWLCFSSTGGGVPEGTFMDAITRDFGDFHTFREEFITAAKEQFGSGWAWLVKDGKTGLLSIFTTLNAENPLGTHKIPLLTADVWEHAYYIDYQNRREEYLKVLFDKINWPFVASIYECPNAQKRWG
ncbi:MAG: superoxide dismutase [Planctomycetia bacterium]|nr:superoxide dismutase [Planctomycetia bacterium]